MGFPEKFQLIFTLKWMVNELENVSSYIDKLECLLNSKNEEKWFEMNYREYIYLARHLMEKIDSTKDEMDVLLLLDKICTIEERITERYKQKCKYLIIENQWMKEEIENLEKKTEESQANWILTESEVKIQHYFYRMRYLDDPNNSNENEIQNHGSFNNNLMVFKSYSFSSELRPFSNIVQNHMMNYRNELAILWCSNLLDIYRVREGSSSLIIADLYTLISRIHHSNGDFYKALTNLNNSLNILKSLTNVSYQLGFTFRFLGDLYIQLNKLDEAEASYLKSLDLQQDSLGIDSSFITDLYFKLALLFNYNHRFIESNVCCHKTFSKKDKLEDKDISKFIYITTIKADNYIQLENLKQAKLNLDEICFRNLHISKEYLNTHSETLLDLIIRLNSETNNNILLNSKYIFSKYGKIHKCFHVKTILIIWRYLIILKLDNSIEILKKWCEISLFDFAMVENYESQNNLQNLMNEYFEDNKTDLDKHQDITDGIDYVSITSNVTYNEVDNTEVSITQSPSISLLNKLKGFKKLFLSKLRGNNTIL